MSWVYSLDAVSRLLVEVASPVAEVGSRTHRASVVRHVGSVVTAARVWHTGSTVVAHNCCLAAPRHVGSSWIRDGTHVPCIGRHILYH